MTLRMVVLVGATFALVLSGCAPQLSQSEIKFLQTDKVVITAVTGTLPAHADGETLCTDGTQLTIELLPNQLNVICPADKIAS